LAATRDLMPHMVSTNGESSIHLPHDIDQSIIGTSFAQFVLEGKVDPELKYFAEKALQREMLPLLTRQYREDYQKSHKEICMKLLSVVSKMKAS
jgi:uncharacterized protein YfeS